MSTRQERIDQDNLLRAVRAGEALDTYANGEDLTNGECLRDLLCDLQHWASSKGLSFADELATADANFVAEINGEDY